MYLSNQEIDIRTYPARCPGRNATKWLDFDWETTLGYCHSCGGTLAMPTLQTTLKQGKEERALCKGWRRRGTSTSYRRVGRSYGPNVGPGS